MEAAEDLSLRLRPSILDDLGIEKAFQWHLDRFSKQTGIQIISSIHLEKGKRYPGDIEITLYRAMEESLTNAVRHGNPTEIEVKVKELYQTLYMSISDNGSGFDILESRQDTYNHSGITGLRERFQILCGTYDIQSTIGEGTTVEVSLPTVNKLQELKND